MFFLEYKLENTNNNLNHSELNQGILKNLVNNYSQTKIT